MNNTDWEDLNEEDRRYIQRQENPENERTGHFTGRCARCGSKDLWDDNLTYGCNRCRALYICS